MPCDTGGKHQKLKRVLIFDVEQFRYQRFTSDLAGTDIHALAGDPVQALEKVRDWLANASRRELPSAGRTSQEYNAFQANLPALAAHLEFDPERIP